MSIHEMEEIKRSVGDVREWLKDQRFTDDDREPDSNINISIEQLNRALALMMVVEKEIERLRAERDEARRSCCEYAAIVDGADTTEGMESGRFYERAMKYMKDRGWDCFKGDK